MRNHDIVPELASWNRLLRQFNHAGLVSQVWSVYSEMLSCGIVPNVATRNIVIHSLCKTGNISLALDMIRDTYSESDTVSYNTVIWGFCKIRNVKLGFGLCSEMVKKGIPFDSFTCNILIDLTFDIIR